MNTGLTVPTPADVVPGAGLPILLNIDVEPDGVDFEPDDEVGWEGFERALEWAPAVRQQLADATGRPVQWVWLIRCDPQLEHTYGDAAWALRHFQTGIDALQAAGDDIGLHVHMFRRDTDQARWVTDFEDAAWVRHCLDVGVAGFESARGVRPVTMSSGIQWQSTDLMNHARRLGFRHDLSCVSRRSNRPHGRNHGHVQGASQDYSALPQHPYSPSEQDFRVPRDTPDALWVLPLTSSALAHPRAAVSAEPFFDRWHIRLGPDVIAPAVAERLQGPHPAHVVVSLRSAVFRQQKQREAIAASLLYLAQQPGARFVDAAALVHAVLAAGATAA